MSKQMDSGTAMVTIAIAGLVAALFMGWKARTAPSADKAEEFNRFAVMAGIIAAVAGFLHYRRTAVIQTLASQYLLDDF